MVIVSFSFFINVFVYRIRNLMKKMYWTGNKTKKKHLPQSFATNRTKNWMSVTVDTIQKKIMAMTINLNSLNIASTRWHFLKIILLSINQSLITNIFIEYFCAQYKWCCYCFSLGENSLLVLRNNIHLNYWTYYLLTSYLHRLTLV